MYMGGELIFFFLLFQKSLFCKTEPLFCCNSAVDVNPPCTPVAVMLPSPRQTLWWPQKTSICYKLLQNQNTLSPHYNPAANWLQERTDQLQWWRTCREAHAWCPSRAELWESVWMAEISTAISQLFIDSVLKWAHFHSKTVSQKYNR